MFGWLDDDHDKDDEHDHMDHDGIRKEADSYNDNRETGEVNFVMTDYKEDTEEKKKELSDDIKDYIDKEVQKRSKKKFGFLKALALVLVGSVLGAFIAVNIPWAKPKDTQTVSRPQNQTVNISSKEEYNVESAVAKKSIPSIVGIQVNVVRRGGFFGEQQIQGQAIGSGVIVSADGYILTNAHVVNDANPDEGVNILFHNNETAVAKVLWKDTDLDLAIVKADKTGLTPIELGDSSEVQVGDKAIAIGNPVGLNLQSTLTSGYISGANRSIKMENGAIMDGLFQTDAAINSGNSGGALVNKEGKLIGINTAKVQSTDGIGFAIPVNVAKPVVKSFIENGMFESVQLGIRGVNLDIFKQYYQVDEKLDTEKGVVISEIPKGGNASRSDLKVKDIIVGINGESIDSMNQLKQHLLSIEKGEKATLNVIRNGKRIDVEVTFEGRESNI